jgi:uncharacterized membrane protein
MTTDAATDYGLVLKDTFHRFFKGENLVPLVGGFTVMALLGLLSLGVALPALLVGYSIIVLRVARGETTRIDDLWLGFDHFGTSFVAGVLLVLTFLLGSVVVVGGVIALFFFSFTFLLLADRPELGAVDALKESAGLVRANLVDVLVIWVLELVLTGLLSPTVIGSLIGGAFATLFTAIIFVRIRERHPAHTASVTAQAY